MNSIDFHKFYEEAGTHMLQHGKEGNTNAIKRRPWISIFLLARSRALSLSHSCLPVHTRALSQEGLTLQSLVGRELRYLQLVVSSLPRARIIGVSHHGFLWFTFFFFLEIRTHVSQVGFKPFV